MSTESESPREKTWSRRKLIAAMGTTAAGLMLGGGLKSAAAAPVSPPGQPSFGNAPGWVNVKDYGAKGNGFAHENDASAIRAAMEVAGRGRFGGTVYFPAGTYMIDSSLVLLSKVRLVGDGIGASTIKSIRSGIPLLLGNQVKMATIEHLSLEGHGLVPGGELVERGVDLKDCEQVVVRNCSFYWIVNGIGVRTSRGVTIEHCSFDTMVPVEAASQGYGIFLEGGERHIVANNRFTQLDKPCIYITAGSSYSSIVNNVASSCKASLITVSSPIQPCSRLRIEGNQVTAAGLSKGDTSCRQGIVLRGYCTDNVIAGNMVARAAEAGIALEGDAAAKTERPTGNLITGNQIVDCPAGVTLVNSDANTVTGNDVRRAKTGISLSVLGEKDGSFCLDNVVTGNALFRCSEAGIRIASKRCQSTGVFGNGGSGNGEAVADSGQDTVRSGF
ncbi:right-handed parallel beta-helix repeat-containing protein [Paenibacillus filicis]|uniref:Right-handed parallel beta-helix repeat-containing protein n=1 Tax=Paenibacillus filicis TaxID=669464 RepID=A0ABU9DUP8_9BACL